MARKEVWEMDHRQPMEKDFRKDPGAVPCAINLPLQAGQNRNFRTALWTGNHLQLTVMEIPPCGEIGWERHPDTDQMIRVEAGQAVVCMGAGRERPEYRCRVGAGEAVLVPCGTWHNVVNGGNRPLKLSSLYAPPQHPRGTVHRTKAEAEKAEY